MKWQSGLALAIGGLLGCSSPGTRAPLAARSSQALTSCPGAVMQPGIDVSMFQSVALPDGGAQGIDWAAAQDAGIVFAIAKATEGLGYTDRSLPRTGRPCRPTG